MTNNLNIDYIRGLVETDGCFMLDFTKTRQVKPWFKFAQKTNTNLIPLFSKFLKKNEISHQLKNYAKNGRAPELVIGGINQLRKFLNLLEKDNEIPFTGVKLRDFLIIREAANKNRSEKLSLATLIGLKKSLHKNHRNDPDRKSGGAKSREELEQQFNVPKNESVSASKQILIEIDKNYTNLTKRLKKQMKNGKLKISSAYICGLVDGDGGIGINFWEANWESKKNKQKHFYLKWLAGLALTMEINSFLTLKVFGYSLKSDKWKTLKKPPKASAARITFIDLPSLKNFMKIHDEFPILGDFRSRQYSLLSKFFDLKENKKLRSLEEVSNYVKEIYATTARKGRKRAKTLEESLALVERILK